MIVTRMGRFSHLWRRLVGSPIQHGAWHILYKDTVTGPSCDRHEVQLRNQRQGTRVDSDVSRTELT